MENKKEKEIYVVNGKISSKIPHSPENVYDGLFCIATLIDFIKKRRIEKRSKY
jgi:hypothetical protein